MNRPAHSAATPDVREARSLFPATDKRAYLNTAAVGLASRATIAAYHGFVDDWTENALDFVRGEAAGERGPAALSSTWPRPIATPSCR